MLSNIFTSTQLPNKYSGIITNIEQGSTTPTIENTLNLPIYGIRIGTNTISACHQTLMASAGVQIIRRSLLWSTIETSSGNYNWSSIDTVVDDIYEIPGAVALLQLSFNNPIYYTCLLYTSPSPRD